MARSYDNNRHEKSKEYFVFYGTSILFFISQENIHIASDSKRLITNSTTGEISEEIVCKINNAGNTWFALSGRTHIKDLNGNLVFNSKGIVDNILSTKQSIEASLKEIDKGLTNHLTEALQSINPNNDFLFVREYAKVKDIFAFALCGFIDSKPYLVVKTYNLKGTPEAWSIVSETTAISDIVSGHTKFAALGESENLAKFIYSSNVIPGNGTTESNMDYLINLEITAVPSHVGGPVRILKINKDNSFLWLQNPC